MLTLPGAPGDHIDQLLINLPSTFTYYLHGLAEFYFRIWIVVF